MKLLAWLRQRHRTHHPTQRIPVERPGSSIVSLPEMGAAAADAPFTPPPGQRSRGTTTDRRDPRLTHGADDTPTPQADVYLVLSEAERAQGFTRPVRRSYIHLVCGRSTRMGQDIAETYARNPTFYGATYCVGCAMHRPVGEAGEFVWEDGTKVGT